MNLTDSQFKKTKTYVKDNGKYELRPRSNSSHHKTKSTTNISK